MLPTPPPSPKPFGSYSPEDRLGQVLGDRIQLSAVLGVGAYGTVYKAHDVKTGQQYAVKALNKLGLDPRQKKFQDREIRLHYQASQHPNVVSMEKILDMADCTYVVLEYCPEGDLFSKITEEGDYVGKDDKAKAVFLQILDAVRHCHANGVYHRDLKPENILVRDNGWTVKLADFGLATQERVTSDFGCGSTFYMSPECQQSNTQSYACYASAPNDIWSLGVILVNLTCGRNPWKRASIDDSTFRAFMRDRNFLQSILPISDNLNCILQRIFEVDPARRISLDALRDYIASCPHLGPPPADTFLPVSPLYSPEQQAVDNIIPRSRPYDGLDVVPQLDMLPVPQYPVSHFAATTPPFNQHHHHYLSPPASLNASPRQSQYTYPAKPAVNQNLAAIGLNIPLLQSWSRCTNLVGPALASHAWIRNVPVF